MSKELKDKAIIFGVIFCLVLIVFISLKSKDRQIEKLQNQVFELKQKQDTLFQSNKDFIETQKQQAVRMDSIYNLTKKSNEVYIVHHWDSVYYTILNNADQSEISNFLRELGKR